MCPSVSGQASTATQLRCVPAISVAQVQVDAERQMEPRKGNRMTVVELPPILPQP